MFESLTFFTVLSAAPAALKFAYDAVGFYSKVKALRLPAPPRPLAKSTALAKSERSKIDGMYEVVEKCRPVAADIAARTLRSYLLIGGVVITVLVVLSVLLISIPSFQWLLSGAMAILGFAFISALPGPVPKFVPFKISLSHMRRNLIRQDLIEELGRGWSRVTFSVGLVVRAGGVSIPERVFLNAYSVAEGFLRSLECDLLTKELREGMSRAHEEFTSRVFDIAVEIVSALTQDGQLDESEGRQEVLEKAFKRAGLGDLG